MHISTSIIAISAAAIIQVSAVPSTKKTFSLASDAPGGFYVHIVGHNGSSQNVHIGDFIPVLPDFNRSSSASSSPDNKARRDGLLDDDQGSITCRNQYVLNLNDVIAAEQGLEAMFQFGSSFDGNSVSYKWGGTVAYGCNYGKGQKITGSWLAAQYARIAQQCGDTSPGWISYPSWKASYGLDSSAKPFC